MSTLIGSSNFFQLFLRGEVAGQQLHLDGLALPPPFEDAAVFMYLFIFIYAYPHSRSKVYIIRNMLDIVSACELVCGSHTRHVPL